MAVKVTKPQVDLREEINRALTLEGLKNYRIEAKNISSSGNLAVGLDVADPLYENGIHLYGPNPSLKIEGRSTSSWEFLHFKQPSYERLIGMRTTGTIVINNGTNLDANNHLVVDTGGNVGIGNSDPDYPLDFGVGDTIRLRHTTANGTAIRVGASDYDVNLIRFDGSSGITDNAYYGGSLRYMGSRSANLNSLSVFMDNSLGTEVEAMTILQNGAVGFGTTTSGIEAIPGRITLGQNTASDQTDYGITILKKGTNASPGTWDHTKGAIQISDVVGQGPAAYSNIGIILNAGLGRLANGDSNTHLGSLIHISYDSGNSPIYMDAKGNTWFGYPRASQTTDSANSNSVKVDGPLYIGNPDSGNGSVSSSRRIIMGEANSNAAIHMRVNGGGGFYSARDEVNSPNQEFRVGHLNGTNRIEISVNNNNSFANGVQLTAGATSWTTFSDERRKTDLAPIENGLEKVATLRAVTGRYNHDEPGTSRSFLIAQDVEKVLPEAVGELTASMDDPTEYKTLSYTDTIPLLVSALKDAKDRIDALEAEINTLKGE